jgi:hypothetical protein
MRELIQSRLDALKSEYDKGQMQLQRLQGQVTSLQETMLRISGAILVLQEILDSQAPLITADLQTTLEVSSDLHPSGKAA